MFCCMFQLQSRVTFHEHLLPVCLPPPNHELLPGTKCTVIGWGKREDTECKFILKANVYYNYCLSYICVWVYICVCVFVCVCVVHTCVL